MTRKEGETEREYMARCIPYLMEKEGYNQRQATAKCYSMWSKEKKEK